MYMRGYTVKDGIAILRQPHLSISGPETAQPIAKPSPRAKAREPKLASPSSPSHPRLNRSDVVLVDHMTMTAPN